MQTKTQTNMIAALALAAAGPGCLGGDRGAAGATTAAALEITSASFVADSSVPAEHCRVHSTRLAAWPAGSQLLIFRGTRLRGMCTVQADNATTPTVTSADQIRASQTLLNERVRDGTSSSEPAGTTPITGVTVRNQATATSAAPAVVLAATTTAQLETVDNTPRELARVPVSPTGVSVAYTVPHPWENDQTPSSSGCGTDCGFGRSYLAWRSAFQSEDAVNDGFWAVGMRGNRNEFNTFESSLSNTSRFHITSTQISTDSFPGLGDLEDADFDYAVSFHGQGASGDCRTGAMIGGRLGLGYTADPLAWRRGIAENIRMLVDPSDPVAGCNTSGTNCFGPLDPSTVRYSTGACSGFDVGEGTTNFVNELAGQGGLQLEIGRDLDQAIYKRIGAAVHEVFDCLNEAPNTDLGLRTSGFPSTSSAGNTYATGTGCRGFVVDADFQANTTSFLAGLQTCQIGGKVHLDVYQRNAAGAWNRVAGGTRTYTGCSPAAFTEEAYNDPGVSTPAFQHATPWADASGEFRVVVYGYSGTHFTPANALPVWASAS